MPSQSDSRLSKGAAAQAADAPQSAEHSHTEERIGKQRRRVSMSAKKRPESPPRTISSQASSSEEDRVQKMLNIAPDGLDEPSGNFPPGMVWAPTSPSTTTSVKSQASQDEPKGGARNDKARDRVLVQVNEDNGMPPGQERARRQRRPSPQRRQGAMEYLVPNSPVGAHRMLGEPGQKAITTGQKASSNGRSSGARNNRWSRDVSGGPMDDRSHRSPSPNYGMQGEPLPHGMYEPRFQPGQPHQGPMPIRYDTPDMPAQSPIYSPSLMHPPFPVQLALPALPPPERLPLSGYDLLSAKLSGSLGGPRLTPIYRRFEALHHRLLLNLQDELAELEEQLHNLDNADTQARRFPGGIFPASRRQENANQGDINWRKSEIFTQIAQKMYQYNQVISSFKETQRLAEPTVNEIYGYKSYLATCNAVVEDEAQFLDAADDLVTLAKRGPRSHDDHAADMVTPMPRSVGALGFPPVSSRSSEAEVESSRSSIHRPSVRVEQSAPDALVRFAVAILVAILAPILTFVVISGFMGRMTVVLLVGVGVTVALTQSGVFAIMAEKHGAQSWLPFVAIYGGLMAVIAGSIG